MSVPHEEDTGTITQLWRYLPLGNLRAVPGSSLQRRDPKLSSQRTGH